MLIINIVKIILLVSFLTSSARADLIDQARIKWPDNIIKSNNTDSLVLLLQSQSNTDRIAACIRLGQLKDHKAVSIIKEAFINERCRRGLEIPYGFKYYSLLSVAEIEGFGAQYFLISTANDYILKGNRRISSESCQEDSLITLEGIFEALSIIGSESSKDYLDSIFADTTIYWYIRSIANLSSLRISLKHNNIYSKTDIAQFLITQLDKIGGPQRQFNKSGQINEAFMIADNLRYLLMEYRAFTLEYLINHIRLLNSDDPRLPLLNQLKTDMEQNPPPQD